MALLKERADSFQEVAKSATTRANKVESARERLEKTVKEQADLIVSLTAELESLKGAKEVAEIATQANMGYKSIIRLIQRRQFNRNSDATRFLKGEINPDDPYFNEMGFESVIKAVMAEADGADNAVPSTSEAPVREKAGKHRLPARTQEAQKKVAIARASKHGIYTASILKKMGLDTSNLPFKYNTEYIHAALSLEQKLVVMLYKDGSRGHEVQEENIFKDSSIKYFLADRAKLYETIEKNLSEYHIERASCWFHARHYLVDAFIVDNRMEPIIKLINSLFYIERESAHRHHTPEQRYLFRLKWSQPILIRILKLLESIRLAGHEYGQLVHRAVNYILDDKVAFLKFLQDGRIEMHNNAIERMFRHIAIGRRNWVHTGSHFAAENIAFMYSLLESCKLNHLNYGEYLEDILTRIMKGEEVDSSFLPNHYVPRQKREQKVA